MSRSPFPVRLVMAVTCLCAILVAALGAWLRGPAGSSRPEHGPGRWLGWPDSWAAYERLPLEMEPDPVEQTRRELETATEDPGKTARESAPSVLRWVPPRRRDPSTDDHPPRADKGNDPILSRSWYEGLSVPVDSEVSVKLGVNTLRTPRSSGDGAAKQGPTAGETSVDLQPFVGVVLNRFDIGQALDEWLPSAETDKPPGPDS